MAIFSAEVNFVDSFPTRFYVNDYLYDNLSTLLPITITYADTDDLISQISNVLGDDSRWRDMLVYHSLGLPSTVKAVLEALFRSNVKASSDNISFVYDSITYNCYPLDVRYFTYYGGGNTLSIFSQYSANTGFIFPLWSSSMLHDGQTNIGATPRSLNITVLGGNRIRLESQYSLSYGNTAIYDYRVVQGDPYAQGGTSGPGGGDGTFDFSSQPVDFQSSPSIGAYDTGMVSMYVPTSANLRSLAAYLWAGPFDPDNFRKLVADPMDAIIGLSILPLTAAEIGTQSAELMVGNISTGLTMPLATRQYVVVDCGTVNVLPKWGAYLDFSPYSKLQLFLPYIGYVDISPDDCMNGTISVRYTVDLLSGTCVVQVKCLDHVLYEFAGTCSCSCPVTAGQYQNVVTSALKLGGALMSSVTSLGGMLGALDDVANTAVSAAKPAISRSGGFGGSSGLMGHQVPYLILTVPRMCTPGDQNVMMGYPSFVTEVLGDLSGYCVVDTIHLSGIPGASTADLEEIDQLLKGGVYL